MIKIVTDSTSYLPKEIIKEYDISVVSLNVVLNDQTLRELDMNYETFYDEMALSKKIPTSSQPAIEEFTSVFQKIIENGDSVVGIFLSSDMSGTFSTAHLIRDTILADYPEAQIELVDARSNSMQLGYAVIEAARLAKEGKSMEEILEGVSQNIAKSRFLFLPQTLEYLKKGGRIGGAAALIGTLLQVTPILTVVDGKTTVFTKIRTRKKAIETLIDTFITDIREKGFGGAIIHHINCEEDALKLSNLLKEKFQLAINIQPIGPVIGLHVGPGTIGIAYYTQ